MGSPKNLQQSDDAMVLYIAWTFGPNGDKPGTTKEKVFYHLRETGWGFIRGIDRKETVRTKKDRQSGETERYVVYSWFVQFSDWTAPAQISKALHAGKTLQVPCDNYGHFWKVGKYVPSERPEHTRKVLKSILKDATKTQSPTKNRFDCLAVVEPQVDVEPQVEVEPRPVASPTFYRDALTRTLPSRKTKYYDPHASG